MDFSSFPSLDASRFSSCLEDISDNPDSRRDAIYAHLAKNFALSNCIRNLADDELIQNFAKPIIGGFLNLGEERGWPDGGVLGVGVRFVRLMLGKSIDIHRPWFVSNRSVFEKVSRAFEHVGLFDEALASRNLPSQSRCCYDCRVMGFGNHAVCRIVGNVASSYGPRKPFFEILVDSGRFFDEKRCPPFTVSVFENEKDLEERYRVLKDAEVLPFYLGGSTFYNFQLKKPKDFLREHQDKIGPNGTRILEALDYLQNQTMSTQVVGNCWIKQPMRALLASLYLELISDRKDLSFKNAWEQANTLYKCIQQSVAIPYIESLLKKVTVSSTMEASAKEAIAKRKAL